MQLYHIFSDNDLHELSADKASIELELVGADPLGKGQPGYGGAVWNPEVIPEGDHVWATGTSDDFDSFEDFLSAYGRKIKPWIMT